MSVDEIVDRMRNNPLLDGITLSGGEPFEQAPAFAELAVRTREEGYDVVTYTGYRWEELWAHGARLGWKRLLEATDLLVDGRFELALKNDLLPFRGSSNQRVIVVRRTIDEGRICQRP